MEITATVSLGEDESRAFMKQLSQAWVVEPTITPEILASRLLSKLFRKWADDERDAFIVRNRAMLETLLTALAVDPERASKLSMLGVEFGADGVLRHIPAATEPSADESAD